MRLQKTGTGPLASLDARIKLVILIVWSVVLALLDAYPAVLCGLAGSLVLSILAAPANPFAYLKTLLVINLFLVFIWLVLPFSFSMPGEALWSFGPFVLTKEGVLLSGLLSLKALGISAGAMAVTSVSSVFELMAAARSLGAPEKLTAMLVLMTRYVRVIGDERERLSWAMKIRGFKATSSLHCLKSYANLAGILLIRGLDRGERVHAAMLCRGYKGRFYFRLEEKAARGDLLALIGFLILAGLVVFVNVLAHN
ncbi:MAG: cobalt ECF transporter T component CbiQ [Deltaproteobacteria bacterium]|jgi:cobalt/nickel transport system permease protein|nr:cobalt ECF transporter T component CbiQ [Deltaproteobacteria bacterium]